MKEQWLIIWFENNAEGIKPLVTAFTDREDAYAFAKSNGEQCLVIQGQFGEVTTI